MKQITKILVSAALSATLLTTISQAKTTKLTDKQIKEIQNKVVLFKDRGVTVTDGYFDDKSNLYLLNTQVMGRRGPVTIPAFLSKDMLNLFVGSAYHNGKKLTVPKDIKKITETVEKGVAFTFGNPKGKTIYLMTDPECPFCRKLDKEKGEALAKYNVKVVLFPLSFHKNAKPMTQWILRGKTDKERADRMKKVMSGDTQWKKDLNFTTPQEYAKAFAKNDASKFFKDAQELKDLKAYLKRSRDAFNSSGARGTPAIYDKDFKEVNIGNL